MRLKRDEITVDACTAWNIAYQRNTTALGGHLGSQTDEWFNGSISSDQVRLMGSENGSQEADY
jgi:hypothetical protein